MRNSIFAIPMMGIFSLLVLAACGTSEGVGNYSINQGPPPCTLKDKLHDEQAFLQELKKTGRYCIGKLYYSNIIKDLYSSQLYRQILTTLEQFHSEESKSVSNYLELSNYFLYFDSYDASWEIPKELVENYRKILKKFIDSYAREGTPNEFKKYDLADYEFELIWGVSLSTRANEILEFLSFLMDCTNNGYNKFNQYRAISALTLEINNSLYILPEPQNQNSPFYNGISPAFLEWYVTLFSHPNIDVQQHTLFESSVFSKARPDVAAFIKQKVLEHIDLDIDYWTRMWAIKALNDGFKVKEDLHGEPLDLELEKQKFISQNIPNVFKLDHITYQTAMNEAPIRGIHERLMHIQEVFFQVTQMTSPVKEDKNSELTVIIMNSKKNYRNYMPVFENYSSNNGGTYFETDGTLHTFERTADESTYTLDELLAHEYTHYLVGRYILAGGFNETGTAYDKNIRWFDEGIAEFFVGTDEIQNKVQLRANLISEIKRDGTNRMQLDQILRSSGNDGFDFYSYAYAFVYFLYTNHPDILKEVIRSIAQNDYYFKSYDDNSLTKILGIDLAALNKEYQDFLQLLVDGKQLTAAL